MWKFIKYLISYKNDLITLKICISINYIILHDKNYSQENKNQE